MPGNEGSFLLTAIAAAVTPVVMISTCATLLISMTNKQMTLGTHIRALTAEYRADACPEPRRAMILVQLDRIRLRYGHVARSSVWLYAAALCFVMTVLTITLSRHFLASPEWTRASLYMFEVGIVLMLGAGVEQFIETRLARGTTDLEMRDVLRLEPPSGRSGAGKSHRDS